MRLKKINDWLPALGLLFFSTIALGWLNFRPITPDRPALVFFAPWIGSQETFALAQRAGSSFISKGYFPFTIITRSDDPAFFSRLHQAGAWLILDSRGRIGCL